MSERDPFDDVADARQRKLHSSQKEPTSTSTKESVRRSKRETTVLIAMVIWGIFCFLYAWAESESIGTGVGTGLIGFAVALFGLKIFSFLRGIGSASGKAV